MLTSIVLEKGWLISTDPENIGKNNDYAASIREDARSVTVPGILQQVFPDYHGVVWYYFNLENPFDYDKNRRLILSFGAVDYYCEVYADGKMVHKNEGPEKPFSIDITNEIAMKKCMLLALRVINPPSSYVVEGFERKKIPRRNIEGDIFRAGACYNAGGITLPVVLKSVPYARISNLFAKNNIYTGDVELIVTTENCKAAADAGFSVCVTSVGDDKPCLITENCLNVGTEETISALLFNVKNPKLWSVDEPNLYEYTVTLTMPDGTADVYTITTGFREFKVQKGFFFLNGKRLFLKSSHTGNCFPGGINVPTISGMEFKDFQLAKASGFNCIRFIATMATPRQLDYCDKLGLMIYEESYASWYLDDSPRAEELYNDSILSMIKRDRNHPCITIWGMLNETGPGDAFNAAKAILPALRKIDDTRLVIFSSGRFDLTVPYKDYTPDFTLGSVSNPGSAEWECLWGDEGEADGKVAGDIHGYMGTPFNADNTSANRFIGEKSKPIYISESGVGSQLDTITLCKEFEQHGIPKNNPDAIIINEINDSYLRDFERYGCGDAYAEPDDFLYDSNRYNGETRRMCFDCIRSNPRFCGYNVTGLLDHCLCGEGPFTLFRSYKPTNYDAFADGFAPLRWCLFTSAGHIYSGDEIELEAVLANEDALLDGKYHADFAITNENGLPVWKGGANFTLPIYDTEGLPKLAFRVFKEKIKLDIPEGRYLFKAYLKNGGAPKANIKEFFVSEKMAAGDKHSVYCYSLSGNVQEYLNKLNVETIEISDLSAYEVPQGSTILVGSLADDKALDDAKQLFNLAEAGARTVFLEPLTFDDNKPAASALPLENKMLLGFPAWVYHKDAIIKKHRLTSGLKTGFMEWDYFFKAYPNEVVLSDRLPDDCASVFFEVGNFEWVTNRNNGKYHAGSLLGSYNHGKGGFVLNMFPVINNVGSSPAGDRLLYLIATDGK